MSDEPAAKRVKTVAFNHWQISHAMGEYDKKIFAKKTEMRQLAYEKLVTESLMLGLKYIIVVVKHLDDIEVMPQPVTRLICQMYDTNCEYGDAGDMCVPFGRCMAIAAESAKDLDRAITALGEWVDSPRCESVSDEQMHPEPEYADSSSDDSDDDDDKVHVRTLSACRCANYIYGPHVALELAVIVTSPGSYSESEFLLDGDPYMSIWHVAHQ